MKYKQLTSEQRYAIYLGLQNGISKTKIAESIGVNPSTIYREINRNMNKRGGYSWRLAQEMADERKERLPSNKSTPEWIKQKVIRYIRKDWSPKQIGYNGLICASDFGLWVPPFPVQTVPLFTVRFVPL